MISPASRSNRMKIVAGSLLLVLCIYLGAARGQIGARSRSNLAPRLRSASGGQNNTSASSTTTSRPNAARPAGNPVVRAANSEASAKPSARLQAAFVEDELPADFYEMPAEQLDLGMNATGRAPVPLLNVAVLQNGLAVDSAVTVHPGTPLEMVIFLDDKSAKVYGLQASYLKVQDDTFRQREEVIIQNGCSLDTYIFGNFEANSDDQSLRAKFRAFKFPDSSFVRFVGTVNVCIKQCERVNCGAGRRKRSPTNNNSKGLVLTVSTVLRIGDVSPSGIGGS